MAETERARDEIGPLRKRVKKLEGTGMEFKDVFYDGFDYPDMPTLLDGGISPGCWYAYVSNTFLNGHLPYLTPVAVFLLERYRDGRSDDPDDQPVSDEEIENVLKAPHTNFGHFQDDVVFVGATLDFWWVLHMDCDVSDCGIGRVKNARVSKEEIVAAARDYCTAKGYSWNLRAEIPIDKLKGWLSFR